MKKSPLVLFVALIAAALALSACGGGGSSSSRVDSTAGGEGSTAAEESSTSSGGDDESQIEDVVSKSATTTGPNKCSEYQTQEFNEQNEHVSGSEALKICEAAAEEADAPAESVDVSNVEVDGETATAEAAIDGSALDGQSVEVELKKEGGDWKLNKFLGFTSYDGAALAERLEEELEGQEGVTPSLARCVAEGFAEASQSEAEAMAFEGDIDSIEKLAKSCE